MQSHDDLPASTAAIDLAIGHPTVDGSTTVDRVSELSFGEAIAVVDGDRVVGLVTRALLAEKLFSRFGHALYGNRPITALAMKDALRVPASTPLELAMAGALARPLQHAYDDLVVVDDVGRYAGLLSVKKLILHQTRVLLAERRDKQRAEARASELAEHADLTSRFLATITHELRAPVNTLIGLSELVAAQLAHGRIDRVEAHVATMRRTSAQLRGLVDDVLDQAKLDAKIIDVHLDTVDLVSLVGDVATATRALVLGKPIEVTMSASEDAREVVTDRLKLRQILTNFASNAAKYTDQGTIDLRVTRASERSVAIAVHDSGSGIPESSLSLLFRPFVQLGDPATRRHGGTGLGLANAKRFADLLEARIEVESIVGHGSIFRLLLPNAQPEVPTP